LNSLFGNRIPLIPAGWSLAFRRLYCEIYFDQLVQAVSGKKEFAEKLAEQKEHYLTFLIFPEETRTHFYTTNSVESINAGIERMQNDLGGYLHPSDLWSRKPIPAIRSSIYELNQIFSLRYASADLK